MFIFWNSKLWKTVLCIMDYENTSPLTYSMYLYMKRDRRKIFFCKLIKLKN